MMDLGWKKSVEEKRLSSSLGKLSALDDEGLGYSGIIECKNVDEVEKIIKILDWQRPCELVLAKLRTYGVKKVFNASKHKEFIL